MGDFRPRPVWLWIDAAATCNLRCRFCYTMSMQSAAVMSVDVFAAIVRGLRESSAQVVKLHLNWRGEPSSNPRLAEMLALVDDVPWEIEWHTNATLLHSERAAELVAANSRQSIYLSLDGGTAESFEANRGAGTWPKALRGAEALLAARGRRRTPRIGIYQLDLGVPPEQYDPRFRALTEQVDRYLVVDPVAEDGGSLTPVSAGPAIPAGPCFWLGNALAVDIHGQAWTCLLRTGTRLGSLVEESVDDVLDRAAELRNRVEQNSRAAVAGCSACRKKAGTAAVAAGQVLELT